MEQIVTAGKSILLSGYLGLSTTICIVEYEKVFHEAYRCTSIVTLATANNTAHNNLSHTHKLNKKQKNIVNNDIITIIILSLLICRQLRYTIYNHNEFSLRS